MDKTVLKHIPQLPAEFSVHSGTIAIFPFRQDIWRNNAKPAQHLLITAINIIAKHERVILCAKKILDYETLNMLNSNIEIANIEYDDIWARDISPFFSIINGKMCGVCFDFNAWGGLDEGSYHPWDKDASFNKAICNYLNIDSIIIKVVMEGGALIHNGQGLAIVTESVLLNRNRNIKMSKSEFEIEFDRLLGIKKVIWLKRGFVYDETDGHVDVFLNFVDTHTLLLAWTDDSKNPQYEILHEVYNQLSISTDVYGRRLNVHKLLMPEPMFITPEEAMGIEKKDCSVERKAGNVLYPTYNNAYIFNGGVLVPTFNVVQDKEAIECYRTLFPSHKIYPLYSKEFLIGGGNFHCIFHEIPEVVI